MMALSIEIFFRVKRLGFDMYIYMHMHMHQINRRTMTYNSTKTKFNNAAKVERELNSNLDLGFVKVHRKVIDGVTLNLVILAILGAVFRFYLLKKVDLSDKPDTSMVLV